MRFRHGLPLHCCALVIPAEHLLTLFCRSSQQLLAAQGCSGLGCVHGRCRGRGRARDF